jgi:hypothetical protein
MTYRERRNGGRLLTRNSEIMEDDLPPYRGLANLGLGQAGIGQALESHP